MTVAILQAPPRERKALNVEFKMDDGDQGTFSGYAAAFNNIDSWGDIIEPGAFRDTLAELKASGRKIPILWQHDPTKVIGAIDPADMYEDAKGLRFTKARLAIGVQQADEARKLMAMGALGGLSIGYTMTTKGERRPGDTCRRRLASVKLYEFSPVTWPTNDDTEYGDVKAAGTKSAFSATLQADATEHDLWEELWTIEGALSTVRRALACDETLTRDQKIAEWAISLGDYSDAMIDWLGRKLDADAMAVAAGALAAPEPDETKAGKVLSGKNRKLVEGALSALQAVVDADAAKTPAPTPPTKAAPAAPDLSALHQMTTVDAVTQMTARR